MPPWPHYACAVKSLLSPPLVWDLLMWAGGLLLVAGLWWIYPPAALIAGGGGLLGLGIWGARVWARTTRNAQKGPDDGAADDAV
jgi:hypothetical protein